MTKKAKTVLSLILAIILLAQLAPFALAADPETPVDDPVIEEYVNISSCNCSCYISGITFSINPMRTILKGFFNHCR